MRANRVSACVALGALALAFTVACSPSDPSPGDERAGDLSLWKKDPEEPYPFTTPIPPLAPTTVDGTYGRHVSVAFAGGRPVPCRRCAPYRIYAGDTRLELDSGRFAVTHEAVGSSSYGDFESRGHFTVSRHEIVFFNDVNCPTTRGRYTWQIADNGLILQVVHDECPYAQLRARYLTALPWSPTERT